ncbi:helix-turn-helix domain-containing protein [Bacteroides fragilis]|uniref:Helix-turn-helix domain-containing protein n=1 Tax=Bacteroides fragilis TaxID=817 RepID=A0A396BW08_BACFG|nr:helix-turn-helix domain-containing protein [Bacteroides fragilis]
MILGAKRLVVTIYIQYHLCLKYEFALARVEELLPLVDDNIPANDKNAVELSVMSDIVIAYEKEHYPIEKPTVVELIELYLEEKGMSQKQLAIEIGISPSRVNDYIAGRSEPTLKIARLLCRGIEYSSRCNVGFLN